MTGAVGILSPRPQWVRNPKLLPLQGKNLLEVSQKQNREPIETLFDLLIEDEAFTSVAVFGMSEQDVTLALPLLDLLSREQFGGNRSRRPAGQETSASPGLWHFPSHSA